jgi:hypothetical protein
MGKYSTTTSQHDSIRSNREEGKALLKIVGFTGAVALGLVVMLAIEKRQNQISASYSPWLSDYLDWNYIERGRI